MQRVAIYARVSTQEQAENGNSLEFQIEKLKAYCRKPTLPPNGAAASTQPTAGRYWATLPTPGANGGILSAIAASPPSHINYWFTASAASNTAHRYSNCWRVSNDLSNLSKNK